MPKSDHQKLSLLYIKDYLEKNSDEHHPVNARELIRMLGDKGIHCERKTIYSDISCLQDYGVSIENRRGKNGGYYISDRIFELVELKLLIDATQSSRFLTQKKSRELIEKLCKQCNRYDAALMHRDVVIERRVKNMNETIYYNVDRIQEAIYNNSKITFSYFDWGIDGQRHYRDRDYVASPYGLCQNNENYYLLAHSERHGVTHYRVDRMTQIELINESRIPCPELTGNGLVNHANQLFQMYAGTTTTVKFRFKNTLANVVVDRFGKETMMIPDGNDHFTFTAKVAVSPMFLSWIIGLNGDAEILYPQNVVESCNELCQKIIFQNSQV